MLSGFVAFKPLRLNIHSYGSRLYVCQRRIKNNYWVESSLIVNLGCYCSIRLGVSPFMMA